MSRLIINLPRMSRVEWNNLAKNRFVDDEIQVWLAKHAHIQARYYLAANESLCREAVDVIMSGKSNVAKAHLVEGSLLRDPDAIRSVYESCKTRISHWRINNFFVRSWDKGLIRHTPFDVLEDIYSAYVDRMANTNKGMYGYYSTALPINIAKHPNCSLKLAIQLSQHDVVAVAAAGRDALVTISRRENP